MFVKMKFLILNELFYFYFCDDRQKAGRQVCTNNMYMYMHVYLFINCQRDQKYKLKRCSKQEC